MPLREHPMCFLRQTKVLLVMKIKKKKKHPSVCATHIRTMAYYYFLGADEPQVSCLKSFSSFHFSIISVFVLSFELFSILADN